MNKLFEFFTKLFKFIPILWTYRHWDYTFMLANMKASTELMLKAYSENGRTSKDILELERFIELLDKHLNDTYSLNNETHNDMKRAIILEETEWKELCKIFEGDKEKSRWGVKAWWT